MEGLWHWRSLLLLEELLLLLLEELLLLLLADPLQLLLDEELLLRETLHVQLEELTQERFRPELKLVEVQCIKIHR